MKVLLAPDSFKGSLSGPEFCAIASRAIKNVNPGAEILNLPMSDGGEGLAEVLLATWDGKRHAALVTDPRGREVLADYVLIPDRQTAVIEFASASGLTRVAPGQRNVMTASSQGTGQLLQTVIDAGVTDVIVGLGGSATNDGGVGLLQALGFRFLDQQGQALAAGGAALQRLSVIDTTKVSKAVRKLRIDLVCDVTAPLLGKHGASQVYAPQKGASAEDVRQLELGLTRFAEVIELQFPHTVGLVSQPGSGAAGGAGMGLAGLLDARINAGFDYVATAVGLSEILESWGPDLVLTGEGCVDSQTLQGKVVQGLAMTAARAGVPCVVLAGQVKPGADTLRSQGVTRMIDLAAACGSEDEAIQQVGHLLEQAVGQLIRDFPGSAKRH